MERRACCLLVVALAVLTGCSNDIKYSADVAYRSEDCAGLAREFGRSLTAEITHIDRTGTAEHLVASRSGQPRLVRDLLALADSRPPETRESLLLTAPVGYMQTAGDAVRERNLSCPVDDFIAAADPAISSEAKNVLVDLHSPTTAESAPEWTFDQWWAQFRSLLGFHLRSPQ